MSSITRGVEVDPRGLRAAEELNGRVDWELGEEGVEEEALLYCWWVKCEVPLHFPVVRELDRARTPESKVRVLSRSLDPIDSIG